MPRLPLSQTFISGGLSSVPSLASMSAAKPSCEILVCRSTMVSSLGAIWCCSSVFVKFPAIFRLLYFQRKHQRMKCKEYTVLAISSSSFTATNPEIAEAISTTVGFVEAPSTAVFHSLIIFPVCFSLTRVPTCFEEVYASRNFGRASVAGSLPFANTRMFTGTGDFGVATCDKIFAGSP